MDNQVIEIPSKKLLSGFEIPQLGVATWRNYKKLNSEGWHTENPFRAVQTVIDNGIRHVDTAEVYLNQGCVGKAVRNFMNRSLVERSSLFLTSKIWNTHHSTDSCHESIDRTLRDLRIDYIDLMLIHYPQGFAENHEAVIRDDIDYIDFCEMFPNDGKQFILSDIDFLETWKALEEAVEIGKIRSIGVANFDLNQLKKLWEGAKIKPSVLQIDISPRQIQYEIREFCRKNGIQIAVLTPGKNSKILEEPPIQLIAKRLQKTPYQVLLRWYIDQGFVILPKMSFVAEIREVLSVFDFRLSGDQIIAINGWNDTPQPPIRTLPAWPFDKKVVKTKLCEIPKTMGIPRLGLSSHHLSTSEILFSLERGCRHLDVKYRDFAKIGHVFFRISSAKLRRKHCHVTARIFPSYLSESHFQAEFQRIQETMNTSFVNLLLLEWPRGDELHLLSAGFENLNILKTWQFLEQEVLARRIGAIGMCNFSRKQLQLIIEHATVTPKVLEIEWSPFHVNLELLEFCAAHGITVVGHAPFGGGYSPRMILEHVEIQNIAKEIQKSPEEVILRWCLEHNVIPVVDRYKEEFTSIFTFQLTNQQIEKIDNLNRGWSCFTEPFVKDLQDSQLEKHE